MLTVMLQLSNRLANVIQRQMRAAFMEAVFDFRRPACGQLFERRHIQVAVVEVAFQRFHVRIKEAAILADAVAADRRLALGHPFFQEGDGFSFGVAHADAAVSHALGQAGVAVGARVPFIHGGEDGVTVVNGDHRTFGQGVEIAVGDNRRHLDDDVGVGVQTGHFQIDPNQVLWVLHGLILLAPWRSCAV